MTGKGQGNFFDSSGVTEEGQPVGTVENFYVTTAVGDHAVKCPQEHAAAHAGKPFFHYIGNTTPYILAPGPDGALPTVRVEMLREGAQDLEARIFVENALLAPELREKLGPDLAQRCQQLLDDRVRAVLLGRTSWLLFGGGPERLERLYPLAGEAAGKLGRHATRD